MKKLIIEIDDKQFAWLEVLAVGLASEDATEDEYRKRLDVMSRAKHGDFGKGVNDIIIDVIDSLVTGIKCKDSWERRCVDSLLSYQGSYIPSSFNESIIEEAKNLGFEV